MTTSLSYRYVTFHPLTHDRLSDYLPMVGPQWSEIVDGDGSFSGKIVVPESTLEIESLRQATTPLQAAIYVINGNGEFVWGGLIMTRTWNPDESTIEIGAVEWRTWLNWRFLSPRNTENPNEPYNYEWEEEDQLFMAQDILWRVTESGTSSIGAPKFYYDYATSGPPQIPSAARRSLDIPASEFRTAASAINEMAHRQGGFEWTVIVEQDPTATSLKPRLHFKLFYPQRGSTNPAILFRHSGATPESGNAGNILSYGSVEESGEEVRQRIWGIGSSETGNGNPLIAVDSEPLLSTGRFLLTEDTWTNTTIKRAKTLASNARQERLFRKPGLNTMEITVSLSNPDVNSYSIGDRGRLIIKDRWLTMDLPSVRIVEKVVSPQVDSGQVTLTLDLTDIRPPESDTGGAV